MTYMPTGSGSDGPGPSGGARRPDAETGTGHPGPDADNGLGRILSLVAAGLGVLIILLGFTAFRTYDSYSTSGYSSSTKSNFFESSGGPAVALLFAAGLLAALRLLPKQPKLGGVAAAVAVSGFVYLVFSIITIATAGGGDPAYGAYLELVLGLILTGAVVAAMLIDFGIVSPSAGNAGRQGGAGAGQYGQPGGSRYTQQGNASHGEAATSQYGSSQFGSPQGSSEQQGGYGQARPPAQAPQGGGYYGASETPQSYGQQSQSPSFGQPAPYGQQQPYGQQSQEPSRGQQSPDQPYGQPQQSGSYPPPGQQQPGAYQSGQQPPAYQQPAQQQETSEDDEQTRAYRAPTQSFGAYAPESERSQDNPYGPPPQQ